MRPAAFTEYCDYLLQLRTGTTFCNYLLHDTDAAEFTDYPETACAAAEIGADF